jgi:parvulin-like peptidyl-prolyl isomerase
MLKFLRGGGKKTATIWWIVAITSAVVFVFGFSMAPSLMQGGPGSDSEILGKVNGEAITSNQYQQAVAQTAEAYRQQTGRDPDAREMGVLEEQAWGQLVTERALLKEARHLGLGASDPEVVFAIRNTPPTWVRQLPVFQTDGRFDFQKYHQALANPNVDWSGLEMEVRRVLPAQKLEELMLASARFSEPELRRAFIEQYEKAKVTLALWIPPGGQPDTASLADTEVREFYEQNSGLFSGPAMARIEVAGADFSQLAADMGEGALARQGGDMGTLRASEIPAAARLPIEALGDSGITDPFLQDNRVFIFKSVRIQTEPEPAYRLWQISMPVRISAAALQADLERVNDLRRAGRKSGLGPAAARMGLAAQQSGWFSATSFDPLVFNIPQIQQFATMSMVGELSPVYDQETGWMIAQVIGRREAGLYPFEEVADEVKVSLARERSQVEAEQAARRARAVIEGGGDFVTEVEKEGATQTKVTELFTRVTPDGVVAGSPRAIGLAFSLEPGQLAGPLTTPLGVYLIRKDASEAAPMDQYDELKGEISTSLLTARQQQTFGAWLDWYRDRSRVEDWRGDVLGPL